MGTALGIAGIALVVISAVLIAAAAVQMNDRNSTLRRRIGELPGFDGVAALVVNGQGLAISSDGQQFLVAKFNAADLIIKALPMVALLGAEVETRISTKAITKTAGFGKSTTTRESDEVTLRIITSDPHMPMLHFPFGGNANVAHEWRARFLAATSRPMTQAPSQMGTNSAAIADRLTVLADLRKDGVISDDDYQKAKVKLLAG